MDVSQRTTTIAGLVMILLAIMTIVSVGLTGAATSDKDPFDKDEVSEFLTDINDNEGLMIAAGATGIINDGVFVPLFAVAVFILFRDRNPFLAAVSMVGIAVAAAIGLVVDISNVMLTIIADDFVNGGPGGIPAGDPALLEVGRYVGMITFAFVNLLFTPLGLGLVALGVLLTRAGEGLINPPRWIGWVAIIGGVASWLAWLVVAAEPFFVFFPVQLIATVVLLLALGIWLLRHGDLQPAPMKA